MSVFGDDPTPRVYGLPPGVDFTAQLAVGIKARLAGRPPEAIARVAVAINTSRAARALTEAFEGAADAVFLPSITTFERFVDDPLTPAPPAIDGLEPRLTLTRLIDRMIIRGFLLAEGRWSAGAIGAPGSGRVFCLSPDVARGPHVPSLLGTGPATRRFI